MRHITRIVLCTLSLILMTVPLVMAETYETIRTDYEQLIRTGKISKSTYRQIGDRFYRYYASNPGANNADTALLYAGKSYKASYENHSDNADMDIALKYLRIVSTNYNTDAAAEAYLESAELFVMKRDLASAQFTLNRVKVKFPGSTHEIAANSMLEDLDRMAKRGDNTPQVAQTYVIPNTIANDVAAEAAVSAGNNAAVRVIEEMDDIGIGYELAEADVEPGGITLIKGIRYFSADDYTRVVIDLSKNATFEKHWLKENPDINMPPRLYVEIFDSEVQTNIAPEMPIKDGLIKSVRWAYNRPGVTRVVLDSESIEDFTVFQMANPSRIVIDVSNKGLQTAARSGQPARPGTSSANPPGNISSQPLSADNQTLAGVFGLKIRTIVIDPGHGGKDPGTMRNGMKEKDIVLEISKYLRDMLQKDKDLKVYMTRETDVFIPLEERTAIANKYKADLFISVHINATQNGVASGVETYVLNVTSDKKSLDVAAFENQATAKSLNDLQGILNDIILNSKLEESLLLANSAQQSLAKSLKLSQKQNLGVKQAPFYVLVGAQMPAVLVEAGFLSNKDDASKLKSSAYRKQIAEGIYAGIQDYIEKYNK